MPKVNFKNLKLKELDETTVPVQDSDIKGICNALYRQCTDIGLMDIIRDLYKGKDVEITEDQSQQLCDSIKQLTPSIYFHSPFVEALNVKEVSNSKKGKTCKK